MIDTDKYEGHTPGPWVFSHHGKQLMVWQPQREFQPLMTEVPYYAPESIADAQLIADAPKLLAEVKRLQKAYEVMGEYLREIGLDYCEHCLRVYSDISDEVLYRHREERCLT